MMNELDALLTLLIIAIGIAVILFGAAGVGKLFGLLLVPLGCLVKTAVIVVALVATGAWLLSGPLGLGQGPGGQVSTAGPPSTAPRVTEVRLTEYPLLAQRDSANYSPAEFAVELDPVLNEPVQNLACLATVYLMLRRGRGDAGAMISAAVYDLQNGAVNPGFVGADIAFDGVAATEEVREGRPVVLHGRGGPLEHHFMLLTGVRQEADGRWTGEVNDPWTGRRVKIDLSEEEPVHPELPEVLVSMMRVVE